MRIFFLLCITFFIFSCAKEEDSSDDLISSPTSPAINLERINLIGVGYYGIFDPSIARDPGNGILWMSYSVVDQSHIGEQAVQLKLASSADNGNTWNDSGETTSTYNNFTSGTIDLTYTTDIVSEAASWESETSSLIYDSSAPLAERWKLFYWRYLVSDNAPATAMSTVSYFVEMGWLAYKTAATPLELDTATEYKLMKGFGYNSAADSTGSPAFSPVAGDALIDITSDFTADDTGNILDKCGGLHEPGAFSNNNAIYLSFTCVDFDNDSSRVVVLFKCDQPCDVTDKSDWTFIKNIFDPIVASSINNNYETFSAPDLFEYNNDLYVTVTPVISSDYNGCESYKFSDIETGSLLTNSGKPLKYLSYAQPSGIFNGACTYNQFINNLGLIQSYNVVDPPVPQDYFRIQSTGQGF